MAIGDDPSTRSDLLALLQAHRSELEAEGEEAIMVFGPVARVDAAGGSDVDLVVRLGAAFSAGGFDRFGRFEALRELLAIVFRRNVGLVEETALSPDLLGLIRREGVRVF